MTSSDWALYDALTLLAERAGATIGEPFQTSRVAMIVESKLRPVTLDCALYKLARDGVIRREGMPGKGTKITLLRSEAEIVDTAA